MHNLRSRTTGYRVYQSHLRAREWPSLMDAKFESLGVDHADQALSVGPFDGSEDVAAV